MKRLLRLALVLVCVEFLFGIAPARANNFNLLSDENLVASSEAIITGHVTYMESRSSGGKIYTDITVSISEVIKGRFSSKTIVIEQLGGRSASHQVWLTNSPEFKIGEEVLLFLSADSQGVMHTTHLSMGKFSISRKGNESLIENAARISNGEKPEKADQYIDKIKRLSAQENVVTAELKTMPSDYQQGKGQFIEEFSNFTLLSRRFFEPDTGNPVNFFVNPANAPVDGAAAKEVNNAITAWNNAGSRLRLVNAGQTSNCGFKMDNQSVISFNDCDKVLDDPVDGQGVMVAVMVVTAMDFRIINGNRFTQVREADIVFNNGFNDVLGVSSNLEELVCKSLGKSFGLDDSSKDPNEPDPVLNQAIMYFRPFFDGRGARLNTDDVNGVNRLYPFFTPVRLAPANFASPIIGVSYMTQIVATDGFPAYTFALASGNLPDGLVLSSNGMITGTPTAIQSTSFTVAVTDSANFRTTQSFSLSVTALRPVIFSVSPSRLCNNKLSTVTITGMNFTATTSVTINSGTVANFTVVDDRTIRLNVNGPGQPGPTADIVVTNPGGTASLTSAFFYAGPQLSSGEFGRVMVRNSKGNLVNKNGITVRGIGIGFNQVLSIEGTPAPDLQINRFANEDYVFYGALKDKLPKGSFKVSVTELDLNNCQSNEITIRR